MMQNICRNSGVVLRRSLFTANVAASNTSAMMVPVANRSFGLTKYKFDDEDWKRNQFQVSV